MAITVVPVETNVNLRKLRLADADVIVNNGGTITAGADGSITCTFGASDTPTAMYAASPYVLWRARYDTGQLVNLDADGPLSSFRFRLDEVTPPGLSSGVYAVLGIVDGTATDRDGYAGGFVWTGGGRSQCAVSRATTDTTTEDVDVEAAARRVYSHVAHSRQDFLRSIEVTATDAAGSPQTAFSSLVANHAFTNNAAYYGLFFGRPVGSGAETVVVRAYVHGAKAEGMV